jgi:hypothetical protein
MSARSMRKCAEARAARTGRVAIGGAKVLQDLEGCCERTIACPARTKLAAGEQRLASLMPGSWNQMVSWLRQIDALREAA